MGMTFENYDTESFYDEMFLPDGSPRPEARQLVERIEGLPEGELVRRHQTAERSLLHTGITFTVYGDEAGTERISLHAVTGTPIRRFANAAERALGRLVAELDYTDIVDVVRSGLHDFLDALQDKLNGVGDEITHTFFAQRWQGESLG